MPFTDSGLDDMVNGLAAAATYISLHTGDPSTTGANEVTGGSYTREQTTWGSASSGDRVGSQVTFDVPAGTTITHWGLFTAASAGTFKYGGTITSETFGVAGQYLFTPTIDVDSA